MSKALSPSVIVIGAGLIGCASAFNLARRGAEVTLIDALEPGQGCSYGNAGLIAVDHVVPLANPDTLATSLSMLLDRNGPLRLNASALISHLPWLIRFARASSRSRLHANSRALAGLVTRSTAAWARLRELKVAATQYRDIGAVYVYERPQARALEQRQLQAFDSFGVQHHHVSAAVLRSDYLPGLGVPISHGRQFPQMASVGDPGQVVTALAQHAASAGARIVRGSVSELSTCGDGRWQVRAGEKTWIADKIVLSAGTATGVLAKQFGIAMPLIQERGYHIQLPDDAGVPLPVPVTFVERGFVSNPMTHGMRLAGTVELGVGKAPNWRRADLLLEHFVALFPTARVSDRSRWFGDRPTFPDYLPMIGAVPDNRQVFIATGHQHLGLTLAPLTGELIAAMVLEEDPQLDMKPYSVDRFANRLSG